MNKSKVAGTSSKQDQPSDEDALRPHIFDGTIQEYDKRLPNWWLGTLYGAILFSVCYWIAFDVFRMDRDPGVVVMRRIELDKKLASYHAVEMSNESLWQMSGEMQTVEAGRATFLTTCAVCHQPDLSGKIGPALIKETWLHGGEPMQIMATITAGVPAKGMPTWGPILGREKIVEATAFILSNQKLRPKASPAEPVSPKL